MELITGQDIKISLLDKPPRNFPNSVLSEIFSILAAARDKHARQAQAVPVPRDAVACIKALSALACVWQGFKQLAQPLLCQTIVISRDAQHHLFFRTLRHNRSLGRLVKDMTFFELRDYCTRENAAFPSLIDNSWDILAPDPVADDMKRLWGQVPRPDRNELGENVPEIRDAVLELLTVLKHLPNLKFLRYVGRASQTMFGSVLTKVIDTIPSWLALGMFRDLEEMEIIGCTADIWFKRIFESFSFPRLRSLAVTYLGSPPAETAIITLPVSFSPLATIRELRLSLPHLPPAYLLSLLVSIDLEVLHLDLFSLAENGSHEDVWFAVSSRYQTLRDLRFLAVLEMPDVLLFSTGVGPLYLWYSMFPPNIQVLAITAWFIKSDVAARLEELLTKFWRVPMLRRIVVREKIGQAPLIKATLRDVVERCNMRNIAYSHEWV
ncbi:hypothetical protein BJX62DRAFT_238296 [Aspergillus germanicus]